MYHASETFVRNHKKTALIAVFFVAVALTWHTIAPQVARAEDAPAAGGAAAGGTAAPGANTAAAPVGGATADAASGINSGNWWLDLFSSVLLAIARLFLSLTLFILTFVIQIAGYNGFLNASAVNVGWVMIRDITNMGFVVILLVIAFGTILGVEHYEWKKMLVKMVIAAVIVNFSRTICGLMIDVAQVVMITFVNGIAATAGGNLIRMFNLDSIRDLSVSADPKSFNSANYFIASIGAVFFSAMVMSVLAVFMVMLVARMIALWILIVLSPLAFVLSVLPQTDGYAKKWWSEFGKNVITGPVLLFFVWLAFVTAGNGKINDEISNPTNNAVAKNVGTTDETELLNGSTSGIGAALEWNNMANFIIAIGMLMVGARAASELGGVGGSWAGEAVDFGKKVGMYASGAMAARYAVGKAGEVAMKPVMRGVKTVQNLGKLGYGKLSEERNAYAKELEKDSEDRGAAKKVITNLKAKQATGGALTADEQAKLTKAEDKLKNTSAIGAFLKNKIAASAIETGGRADKRVEDLEKAAHAQDVIVDETYSTSKSWQGEIKLNLGVREHQIEQFAKAKREQKYAEKELEFMENGDKTFAEREETIISAGVKTKRASAVIEAHKVDDTLEAELDEKLASKEAALENKQIEAKTTREKRKLGAEEEQGTVDMRARAERAQVEMAASRDNQTSAAQQRQGVFDAKAVSERVASERETREAGVKQEAQINAGVLAAKARQENAQAILAGVRNIETAKQRAAQMRNVGKNAEAAAILTATYSAQFEADQKPYVNMSQPEKVNEAARLAGDLHGLQAQVETGVTLSAADTERLRNLRRGSAQMLTAASKDGQETFQVVLKAMLQQTKGNTSISAETAGQDLLHVLTGSRTIANSNDFEAKQKIITTQTFRDGTEAQAILKLLADQTNGLASKGEVRMAGAVEAIPVGLSAQNNMTTAEQAEGAASVFRLYNPHAAGRKVRDDGTTAGALKSGMQGYFAPRVNTRELEYISGFADTTPVVVNATTGEVADRIDNVHAEELFSRLSKFRDSREVASGFTSAFTDSVANSKFTANGQTQMVTFLTRLRDHYKNTNQPEVWNKMHDTIFSDWAGVAGVPTRI